MTRNVTFILWRSFVIYFYFKTFCLGTTFLWTTFVLILSIDYQEWEVFVEVKEIMIMVPPLIGLKGNLEMTLAARLSTAANIGHMDRQDTHQITSNLNFLMRTYILFVNMVVHNLHGRQKGEGKVSYFLIRIYYQKTQTIESYINDKYFDALNPLSRNFQE